MVPPEGEGLNHQSNRELPRGVSKEMRMFSIITCMLLSMLISDTVNAAEKKARKPKPALQDLVLTGTVEKKERKLKKSGKVVVTYVLATEGTGNVTLPKSRGKDAPNLDVFVGRQVNVTGKGTEQMRGGKKRIRLIKLTTIENAVAGDAEEEAPVQDADETAEFDVDMGATE